MFTCLNSLNIIMLGSHGWEFGPCHPCIRLIVVPQPVLRPDLYPAKATRSVCLQVVRLCAVNFGGAYPSSPTGAAVALPDVRGKVSPCLKLTHTQPKTCAGYITGMPTWLLPVQVRIVLHKFLIRGSCWGSIFFLITILKIPVFRCLCVLKTAW